LKIFIFFQDYSKNSTSTDTENLFDTAARDVDPNNSETFSQTKVIRMKPLIDEKMLDTDTLGLKNDMEDCDEGSKTQDGAALTKCRTGEMTVQGGNDVEAFVEESKTQDGAALTECITGEMNV